VILQLLELKNPKFPVSFLLYLSMTGVFFRVASSSLESSSIFPDVSSLKRATSAFQYQIFLTATSFSQDVIKHHCHRYSSSFTFYIYAVELI